jgi:hypothetical protein
VPHANILFTGDTVEPIGERLELLRVYVAVVFAPLTVELILVIDTLEPFIYMPTDTPAGAELAVFKNKVVPEI